MAQYGLFVLKVWLNNNQPTNLWQKAGLLGHNPVTVLIGQHAVRVGESIPVLVESRKCIKSTICKVTVGNFCDFVVTDRCLYLCDS